MFCATETAIYVTINGGKSWNKVPGAPTISFRDITIQKRENDLVGASFGRGFFVLDDYSALREMTSENLSKRENYLIQETLYGIYLKVLLVIQVVITILLKIQILVQFSPIIYLNHIHL